MLFFYGDELMGNSFARVRLWLNEACSLLSRPRIWLQIGFGVVWDDKAVLVEGGVLKRPYGWVFFYQSRSYVETGDPLRMMGGNAPILIERINGEIRVTGTAYSTEAYLAAYEETIAPARLKLPLPDEP